MPNVSGRSAFCTLLLACLFVCVPRLDAGHYTWTTAGPEAGYVHQIVVSPGDSNSLLLTAGFYGPLLFRTVDGGDRWFEQESVFPSRLAQDPSNPQVLYTVGSSGDLTGVLKTTDRGATWFFAGEGLPTAPGFVKIAISPSAPATLYAVVADSPSPVYRSDDGASSWTHVSSGLPANYFEEIVVDPSNSSVIYAPVPGGFLKSGDGGATWSPTAPIAYPSLLRIDPGDPDVLYAGTHDAGLFRSPDGGASWSPANAGIADHGVLDVAIDPANTQKMFAATSGSATSAGGLFVSLDGAQQWQPVDLGATFLRATAVAIDAHDSSLVYAAGRLREEYGVLRSADGGLTWELATKGISGFPSYGVAPHPSIHGRAIALSGLNVFRSDAAGTDWAVHGTPPYGLTSLLTDPTDGDVLHGAFAVATPGDLGVLKSVDGGVTWNPETVLETSVIWRLAISPSSPDRVYAATFDGLFGSAEGGGDWTLRLPGDVRCAASDPAAPDILYAGLAAGLDQDGLLRSEDGGASWEPPSGLPSSYLRVSDIVIPGGDPTSVYVAAGSGGVHRSLDRGLSFALAEAGIAPEQEPYRLVADPTNDRTLFVATVQGGAATPAGGTPAFANIFRTADGAESWKPLPGFLPTWYPFDFAIDSDGRVLYASTVSGVFQFERSFLDVPDTDAFWPAIDVAALNGVSSGCGGGNYCPSSPTTRASVAVFLLRGSITASYRPPPATGSVFADVPEGSPAAAYIEELFRRGITSGCGGGDYCPAAPVTRAAMAILLLKTEHGGDYVPPSATGSVFSDVPADAFAADWIEQLAAEGVTAGCGSGRFCPDAAVSRAQAAALVVRALGLS